MKHLRSHTARLIIAFAGTSLACDVYTPVGDGTSPGFAADYETGAVPGPGGTGALVRVKEGQHEIAAIAVTSDHLYFASRWEAVYRASKAGGDLAVAEANTKADYGPMTTSRDDVFWSRTTFGARDYPRAQIKRQGRDGAAPQVVFEADWGLSLAAGPSSFHADDSSIYATAHDAGSPLLGVRRIPLSGGAAASIVALDEVVKGPTWVADDTHVFTTVCAQKPPGSCPIQAVPKQGGAAEVIATVPGTFSERVQLVATDDTSVYLLSWQTIWKVAKRGGEVVVLFTAPENHSLGGTLAVDERAVYFLDHDRGGMVYPRALPKAGGPPQPIADGSAVGRDVRQMVQDKQNLYFLRGGRTITVHSKTPTAPLGL